MADKGLDAEWAEVVRGLDNLQQVELLLQGSRFLMRGELEGDGPKSLSVRTGEPHVYRARKLLEKDVIIFADAAVGGSRRLRDWGADFV